MFTLAAYRQSLSRYRETCILGSPVFVQISACRAWGHRGGLKASGPSYGTGAVGISLAENNNRLKGRE